MNFDKYITDDILFKKDIDWNISGAFAHDDLLMTFINSLRKNFGIEKSITTVHGCPPVLWNGGREPLPMTKQDITAIIDRYVKNGIKVYLTFSNALIRGKHLNDKESNYLLDKIAEQKNNGIIISSDELSKYIRDKYPHLTQVASVIKTDIYKGKRDKAFYDELTAHFDRVVISPHETLNFPLLNSLKHKDKIEILLNEKCIYKCKLRGHHRYRPIKRNIFYKKREQELSNKCIKQKLTKVHYGEINNLRSRNLNFTINELNAIYDMDFRHFKLQGRTELPALLLYDLCRYMLKEDIAPFLFKRICHTNIFKQAEISRNKMDAI